MPKKGGKKKSGNKGKAGSAAAASGTTAAAGAKQASDVQNGQTPGHEVETSVNKAEGEAEATTTSGEAPAPVEATAPETATKTPSAAPGHVAEEVEEKKEKFNPADTTLPKADGERDSIQDAVDRTQASKWGKIGSLDGDEHGEAAALPETTAKESKLTEQTFAPAEPEVPTVGKTHEKEPKATGPADECVGETSERVIGKHQETEEAGDLEPSTGPAGAAAVPVAEPDVHGAPPATGIPPADKPEKTAAAEPAEPEVKPKAVPKVEPEPEPKETVSPKTHTPSTLPAGGAAAGAESHKPVVPEAHPVEEAQQTEQEKETRVKELKENLDGETKKEEPVPTHPKPAEPAVVKDTQSPAVAAAAAAPAAVEDRKPAPAKPVEQAGTAETPKKKGGFMGWLKRKFK